MSEVQKSDDIERGIEALRTVEDTYQRNNLAMDLAETGDLSVRDAILELITRPDLVNHRGTLVYALENYDLSDHFAFLVDLVKTGNWVVAHQAVLLIDKLNISGPHIQKVYFDLRVEVQKPQANDWRADLLDELIEMFD